MADRDVCCTNSPTASPGSTHSWRVAHGPAAWQWRDNKDKSFWVTPEGKAVLCTLSEIFNKLAASVYTAPVPDPDLDERQQLQQQQLAGTGTSGAALLLQTKLMKLHKQIEELAGKQGVQPASILEKVLDMCNEQIQVMQENTELSAK
ncbi:hypothetical protein PLESTM_002008200 [Pleodorina starrii]|nr:hypothetical protein PLESTM_002008200 [Pleodorina starrii]